MTSLHERLSGFNAGPPIQIEGGFLYSIRNRFSVVTNLLELQRIPSADLLAFGQNGSKQGVTESQLEAHVMIVVRTANDVSVPYEQIQGLFLEGFEYAHMVTTLNMGARIGVFSKRDSRNPHIGMVLSRLAQYVHGQYQDQKIAPVLFLVGDTNERMVIGKMHTDPESVYAHINLPDAIGDAMRCTALGMNGLLLVAPGSKQVWGIDAANLREAIKSSTDQPKWSCADIGLPAEELAVVDGYPNVIAVTVSHGDIWMLPYRMRFTDGELYCVQLAEARIFREDHVGVVLPPVVRVQNAGEHAVLVSPNGVHVSEQSLLFGTLKEMVARTRYRGTETRVNV